MTEQGGLEKTLDEKPEKLDVKLKKKLKVGLTKEEREKYGYGSEDNLEEVVRNHKHTSPLKKLFNYAIGIGAMAASYAALTPLGPLAALIGPGAGLLGVINDYINCKIRKRDYPSRQFRNTALTWSMFAIPGMYAYQFMNAAVNVKTTAGLIKRAVMELFGFQPAFGALTSAISYPLENKKFKGLYGFSLKKIWWPNYKTALKYFSIPEMLIARYLPPIIQFPLLLTLRTLWGVTFGSRYVRTVDPYLWDHYKIKGKTIDEWKETLAGKVKNGYDKAKDKLSHLNLNPFNNYQPAYAYNTNYR